MLSNAPTTSFFEQHSMLHNCTHGVHYVALITMFFRVTVSLILRTTFVPDEYYQVVEPAFKVATGAGITTWEWESAYQIRSFVPLLPFIGLFKTLNLLGLDYVELQSILPRALQAFLSAGSDVCLYSISRMIGGSFFAACVILLNCLSWSSAYCMSRTLANSTETSLIVIGAYFLLKSHTQTRIYHDNSDVKNRNQRSSIPCKWLSVAYFNLAVVTASISVFCRSTSAFIWAPLFLYSLYHTPQPLTRLIKQCIPIGLTVCGACTLIDSYFYGTLTLTPLNFYTANITHNFASLFGVNSWHWNFTHGLPVVLGLYFPLLLYGCSTISLPKNIRSIGTLPLLYAVGLSIVSPHQEYRFLLPCLPFLHIVLGYIVCSLLGVCVTGNLVVIRSCNVDANQTHSQYYSAQRVTMAKIAFRVMFGLHALAIVYLLRYHQSGTEVAMTHIGRDIRKQFAARNGPVTDTTVYLAAPCYSFPGYSFIHTAKYPVNLVMPECTIGQAAQTFDASPAEAVTQIILKYKQPQSHTLDKPQQPVYLVTFDAYLPALNGIIQLEGFGALNGTAESVAGNKKPNGTLTKWVFPHALFRYDYDEGSEFKGNVVVFRWSDEEAAASSGDTCKTSTGGGNTAWNHVKSEPSLIKDKKTSTAGKQRKSKSRKMTEKEKEREQREFEAWMTELTEYIVDEEVYGGSAGPGKDGKVE